MSAAMRDRPQQVTLCDLCGEEMPEHLRNEERAHVVKGYLSPKPETPPVKWWHLFWDPPHWPGTRRKPTWKEQLDNPRWRTREYDMHTECLLRVVEHAIALREDGERP